MSSDDPVKCDDHPVVVAGGYSIVQWSPDPEGVESATQVHLVMSMDHVMKGAALALRLNSRDACQELIDGLIQQRDGVWPAN